MIPPSFDYVAPQTISDAVAALSQNENAKVLAGGQSLIPVMRFRLASPEVLVDINRIEGLSYIREEDGWLKIGAMTREADVEHSSLVSERYPLLADVARVISDPVVRNMGTVGGNLANADPGNDQPATMLAYGAEVVATGPNGERVIPIGSFFLGLYESALARDEILTEVRVPAPRPRSGGAYLKFERKVGDFGTVAVAAQVELDENDNFVSVGLGLTNVGLTAIQAAAAEDFLKGKAASEDNIRQAASLAAEAAQPIADFRGSEEYKRSLVKTYTVRALRKAVERAKGG
ncbi:MAG TPA: xanthine dehydrogenase family protein subunit M [Anaerolineales bacterium]|nr:xanthine dehydrogenase family protein subunit M [Anaerolineales bacterium]